MKIFISWSGELSHKAAKAFKGLVKLCFTGGQFICVI